MEPIISSLLDKEPELKELVYRYVRKLPALVERLQALFTSQDWQEFHEEIHQLKGTGGNIGYNELSELAAQIEAAYLNEMQHDIPGLLSRLEQLCLRIAAGIDDH